MMAEQKEQPKFYYLLLAGTTDSKNVYYTDKKRDQGNYLNGVKEDLRNMENYVNNENAKHYLQNTIRNMKGLETSTVLKSIKECAVECRQEKGHSINIYHTGH